MGLQLKERSYPLHEGEGVDDVCNKIVTLAGLPYPIETIIITKSAMKVATWEPDETEPPYGELPYESPASLGTVLQSIQLREMPMTRELGIKLESLAVLARMLMEARANDLAGTSWVVGDPILFCKWLGIKPTPVRFLDLPILQFDQLPRYKVVLLCSKSAKNHPFTAVQGITASMEIEEGEDAEV